MNLWPVESPIGYHAVMGGAMPLGASPNATTWSSDNPSGRLDLLGERGEVHPRPLVVPDPDEVRRQLRRRQLEHVGSSWKRDAGKSDRTTERQEMRSVGEPPGGLPIPP